MGQLANRLLFNSYMSLVRGVTMFNRETVEKALNMLKEHKITVLRWHRTSQGAVAMCECGGLVENCELTPAGVRSYLGY